MQTQIRLLNEHSDLLNEHSDLLDEQSDLAILFALFEHINGLGNQTVPFLGQLW